jgi:hypothetical protein
MCVFDKFPKYHMKILLGDFNAKVGREEIFKLTGDVDWIGLAQDRNRWRALVNSVLNVRVP